MNLKNRIQELADLTDEAYERKHGYITERIACESELEKFEEELKGTIRRMQLLETENAEFAERLVVAEAKLAETTRLMEEYDEARNKLEDAEAESDDKMMSIEEKLTSEKRMIEINITKLREEEMKKVVLQRDTEKSKEKADSLEERVNILEESIEKSAAHLEELEDRDSESADREEINIEKIAFMESQVMEVVARGDHAERQCGVLDRSILELSQEMGTWKQMRENLEREMSSMDEVAKIEDDIEIEITFACDKVLASNSSIPAISEGRKGQVKDNAEKIANME